VNPLDTIRRTVSVAEEAEPDTDVRVSSLELFSDLVFVFAITQLTTVPVNHRTWAGLVHVLLF
jgi:low temperature requirement protein LtrA